MELTGFPLVLQSYTTDILYPIFFFNFHLSVFPVYSTIKKVDLESFEPQPFNLQSKNIVFNLNFVLFRCTIN